MAAPPVRHSNSVSSHHRDLGTRARQTLLHVPTPTPALLPGPEGDSAQNIIRASSPPLQKSQGVIRSCKAYHRGQAFSVVTKVGLHHHSPQNTACTPQRAPEP